MNNSTLFKVGRILFGVGILLFGVFHMMGSADMAVQVLPGWPMAQALVIISGLGLILAGIALIINKMVWWASMLLALEIFIITVGVHIMKDMMSDNDMEKQMGMIHTIHNFITIGFCFVMASLADEN